MYSRPGVERAILSIIINDRKSLYEVFNENIKSKHFSVKGHKTLFNVIMHLVVNEEVNEIDSMIVYNTITDSREKENVDELGGIDYIESLINACIFNNIDIYIGQLKATFKQRGVYEEFKNAVEQIEKGEDIENTLNLFESGVSKLLIDDKTSTTYKVGTNARERLKERLENPQTICGYAIGWDKFDNISQGFQSNDLVVVVGASKTGKSTLLTNWTERLASSGLSGLYIDTEMEDDEFEDRLVSLISEIPFEEIRNGMYGKNTKYGQANLKIQAVNEAINTLEKLNIYHEYMPNFNIETVSSLAKYYKREKDIDFLVFDYIKMPNSDVNNNAKEYERLGYFTTCLKDLAGTLKIPVITASQSNRSNMEDTDPDASQIQGSYRILQLASKLYFIRNKTDYELTNENYAYGNQVLHIKYQRHGGNNEKINIQFDRPILKQRECN